MKKIMIAVLALGLGFAGPLAHAATTPAQQTSNSNSHLWSFHTSP